MTPIDLPAQSDVNSSELREFAVEGQHFGPAELSGLIETLHEETLEGTQGSAENFLQHHRPAAALVLRESALENEVAEPRSHSLSANSQRGYATDWKNFTAWCVARRESIPASADTTALYMVDRSGTLANASLTRAIASISRHHREVGFQSPTQDARFRQLIAGIRRKKRAPQVAKQALLVQDLFEILKQIPGLRKSEAVDHRDRALLVIGFCGALRRSELVNLDVEDVRSAPEGVILTLRWSKTDQAADGVEIGIPKGRKLATCPVTLLRAWLDYSKIASGPISGRSNQTARYSNAG